tara:strand:- start:329 stop:535 length:207 start_codon:yes stop_codon:yes gene_type:complete
MNVTTRVVGNFKIIEIREDTDGAINRRTLSPLDDTSAESDEIKALVAEHHTDSVKNAYTAAVSRTTQI